MRYAKLIGGALVYAPRKVNTTIDDEPYVVYNPPAELLEADGWLPVVYTDPPVAPEGYHYEHTYTEKDGEIVQGWTLEQDEITEESALVRYANEVTGADDPDIISAAETMLEQLTEV